MSDMTVEEVESRIGSYSDDELVVLASDERQGVRDAVAREQARRAEAARAEAEDEAGNFVRYEDRPENQVFPEGFEPAPLSAPEVDPEEARRDETTILATD